VRRDLDFATALILLPTKSQDPRSTPPPGVHATVAHDHEDNGIAQTSLAGTDLMSLPACEVTLVDQ
jgi:hypothetical protein